MSNRKKQAIPTPKTNSYTISQSLINDIDNDTCPLFIKWRYIDLLPPDIEDEEGVMFKGRYFEWHLLGATRDGIEPIFTPLKTGAKPAGQTGVDNVLSFARATFKEMNIDVTDGEKQVYIEAELNGEILSGNIDWRTVDPFNPGRKCIIDVKYTETKIDDRYNGWADFDAQIKAKRQATQYILLEYLKNGEYLPFYFFVFGKSGWVRILKINLTSAGIYTHEQAISYTVGKMTEFKAQQWEARPEYRKCLQCPYYGQCDEKITIPTVEVFEI